MSVHSTGPNHPPSGNAALAVGLTIGRLGCGGRALRSRILAERLTTVGERARRRQEQQGTDAREGYLGSEIHGRPFVVSRSSEPGNPGPARRRIPWACPGNGRNKPALLHTPSTANFCPFCGQCGIIAAHNSDREKMGRWSYSVLTPPPRHGAIHFALGFALLDVLAPVVLLLAVDQRQFHFHAAVFFVQ